MEFRPEEQDFYQRAAPVFRDTGFPLLEPSIGPRERTERRCAFRNQRSLYRRACDLTGKPHITIYHPETSFPVYNIDAFWGDGWDAVEYGRDYNPQRPFLEQVAELYSVVPRLGMMNRQCQNSEYCNYSYSNKNCYLVFSSHYEEDCLHGNCSTKDLCCVDYHWCAQCELCYECLFSFDCYHCVYLDHCSDCSECNFCVDCHSCKHCLFSANLRHKEYCLFNEQLTKADYQARVRELRLDTRSGLEAAKQTFTGELRRKFPFRAVHQVRCENCEGTDHTNSRNLIACFQADKSEDTLHSTYLGETYNCVDVNYMGFDRCELSYQCIGCTSLFHGICCDSCWHGSELLYCSYCFSSSDCLGCMSLRHKKYCILNKQYSKEDYQGIAAQIAQSMTDDGVWGEFFPRELGAFAYNETAAQDWYPKTRVEAEAAGYRWRERSYPESNAEPYQVSDSLADVQDDIIDAVLLCEESGAPFKVSSAELDLLRRIGVPIPRYCPDVRQQHRLKLHAPWQLWERSCDKTGEKILTTFAPGRPEIVYSVEAYLREFA